MSARFCLARWCGLTAHIHSGHRFVVLSATQGFGLFDSFTGSRRVTLLQRCQRFVDGRKLLAGGNLGGFLKMMFGVIDLVVLQCMGGIV